MKSHHLSCQTRILFHSNDVMICAWLLVILFDVSNICNFQGPPSILQHFLLCYDLIFVFLIEITKISFRIPDCFWLLQLAVPKVISGDVEKGQKNLWSGILIFINKSFSFLPFYIHYTIKFAFKSIAALFMCVELTFQNYFSSI
jgi:hypothetical protein